MNWMKKPYYAFFLLTLLSGVNALAGGEKYVLNNLEVISVDSSNYWEIEKPDAVLSLGENIYQLVVPTASSFHSVKYSLFRANSFLVLSNRRELDYSFHQRNNRGFVLKLCVSKIIFPFHYFW